MATKEASLQNGEGSNQCWSVLKFLKRLVNSKVLEDFIWLALIFPFFKIIFQETLVGFQKLEKIIFTWVSKWSLTHFRLTNIYKQLSHTDFQNFYLFPTYTFNFLKLKK